VQTKALHRSRNDFAIRSQKSDSIREPFDRILQRATSIARAFQTHRQIVGTLAHQTDFTLDHFQDRTGVPKQPARGFQRQRQTRAVEAVRIDGIDRLQE
jgi:hypothetical protein